MPGKDPGWYSHAPLSSLKIRHRLVTPHRCRNIIKNDLSAQVLQVSEVRIANITTPIQHVFRQLALDVEKLIKLSIKGREILCDNCGIVDANIFGLSDTICPVSSLVFARTVPRPRKVDHMICSLNIDPEAYCKRREDDYAKTLGRLKCFDSLLTIVTTIGCSSCITVDDVSGQAEPLRNGT
jgi:hypothetical protein